MEQLNKRMEVRNLSKTFLERKDILQQSRT